MSAAVPWRMTYSAVAAVAFLALSACGGTGYDQAPATSAQTTSPSTSAASSAAVSPGTGSAAVSAGAAAAVAGEGLTPDQEAELQQAVDQGHQPWRLDPAAVAQSFAAARFGWAGATAAPTDADTVEVTDLASGAKASLEEAQPVRQGAGGIWVVVSGTRLG